MANIRPPPQSSPYEGEEAYLLGMRVALNPGLQATEQPGETSALSLRSMSEIPTSGSIDNAVTNAGRVTRWRAPTLVKASIALHAGGALGLAIQPQLWPWIVGGLIGNHAVITASGLWPRGQWAGPNLVRLPAQAAERGEVSLTFDDGPDPNFTPRVLDLLDRHGARASFFCVGDNVVREPDLTGEIARRGHSVENHTYSHGAGFAAMSGKRMQRDIEAAQDAIATAAGVPPTFFRAPMGFRSILLDPVMARLGLRYVSWTRRGYDTSSSGWQPVLARLSHGLAGGDILVMHDGSRFQPFGGERCILEVLPRLLELIASKGLRSVPLPMAFDHAH